jgi:hypothetical protein
MKFNLKAVTVAAVVSLGIGGSIFFESKSSAGIDPQATNAKLNSNARDRYPSAKDPVAAFLSDCLSDRGAKYDEAEGQTYFGTGQPEEYKVMMQCFDDLANGRPLTKR